MRKDTCCGKTIVIPDNFFSGISYFIFKNWHYSILGNIQCTKHKQMKNKVIPKSSP